MHREFAVPGVGTLWVSGAPRTGSGPESAIPGVAPASPGAVAPAPERLAIPADGCADLILRDDALIVAGPSTRWLLPGTGEDPRIIGLRFARGRAGAGLGRPSSDLADLVLPAADAVDPGVRRRGTEMLRALREQLFDASGAMSPVVASAASRSDGIRASILSAAGATAEESGARFGEIIGGRAGALWVAEAMRSAAGREPFSALAARLGYSERQLHRRMLARFGYGHAALRRVLRAERARAALRSGSRPAEAAQLAGYSDQAHLTREFARLVGTSPGRLAAAAAVAAQPASPPNGA